MDCEARVPRYWPKSCRGVHEGFLATDHVILNHGQVTWATSELAPPLLTTTPHQREDISALDRFNVHRCPTRRVFSGTEIELVTKQATIRYLYHSASAATLSHEMKLLDDWNVDVPSWKYPRNLESPGVSCPGFGNDSKMMVMRVDVTAQITPSYNAV
ncbi:uncharacterized protein TNCV_3851331 [Trichonephila clavipes]|nr:uncharacterized protein TNCV_3851331 [Trichonephila clavipes]